MATNTRIFTASFFLTRVPGPLNEKRIESSTNTAGTTGYPHAKRNEVGPLCHTIYKT